jgi:hypothetical protein
MSKAFTWHRKDITPGMWLLIGLWLGASTAISYMFALLNEPQSVWIWRDILGVL